LDENGLDNDLVTVGHAVLSFALDIQQTIISFKKQFITKSVEFLTDFITDNVVWLTILLHPIMQLISQIR